MKFFLDTEFIDTGRTIDLLSIGIVREDGCEFYRECNETDLNDASDWVVYNVFPQLKYVRWNGTPKGFSWYDDRFCVGRQSIRDAVREFIGSGAPEFYGYYSAYDWVALCQLFGPMVNIPEHWPKFCYDINQMAAEMVNPTLPPQTGAHNALRDAHWVRLAYMHLSGLTRIQPKP